MVRLAERILLYLLYYYKSMNTDAGWCGLQRGDCFTFFTSTKVRILTQKAELGGGAAGRVAAVYG